MATKVINKQNLNLCWYLLVAEDKLRDVGGSTFSVPITDVPLTIVCPDIALF